MQKDFKTSRLLEMELREDAKRYYREQPFKMLVRAGMLMMVMMTMMMILEV